MERLDIVRLVAMAAEQGKLSFSPGLQALLAARQASEMPDGDANAMVAIAHTEPVFSAQIVAIASSAAYGPAGSNPASVREAVDCCGTRVVRTAAIACIVKQLAGMMADPALQKKRDLLWAHTAHVAALARVIASRVNQVDPEAALQAGLLHEVGGFYLLSRLDMLCGLMRVDAPEWPSGAARKVSRRLMEALAVPAAMHAAINELSLGTACFPPRTLADTVALADYLAPVISPVHGRSLALSAAKGGTTLAFVIGLESLNNMLEEASDEVKSLVTALSIPGSTP